jgi:hypothetical protein
MLYDAMRISVVECAVVDNRDNPEPVGAVVGRNCFVFKSGGFNQAAERVGKRGLTGSLRG